MNAIVQLPLTILYVIKLPYRKDLLTTNLHPLCCSLSLFSSFSLVVESANSSRPEDDDTAILYMRRHSVAPLSYLFLFKYSLTA